ncbi:UNKNOWN [Stylonychia lemnae]|uniref:DNA/RNA-binding protein Alba-like domain-containing protein n=1 Tax=Stylonychia lemnae TaxID=5949 RepID=A0A078AS48_STYLE|nr:UNKNOWN [Stylonychia lemnae]|eukprot:CDW85305.1 UNKNOWN [Stylonychia lemnae]
MSSKSNSPQGQHQSAIGTHQTTDNTKPRGPSQSQHQNKFDGSRQGFSRNGANGDNYAAERGTNPRGMRGGAMMNSQRDFSNSRIFRGGRDHQMYPNSRRGGYGTGIRHENSQREQNYRGQRFDNGFIGSSRERLFHQRPQRMGIREPKRSVEASKRNQFADEASNIIQLRQERGVKFYIRLVKSLMKHKGFDTVELHGTGDAYIFDAVKITEVLLRYSYVTISRMKTKTIFQGDRRAAKIVIQLTKSADFEELYDKFQEIVSQKIENDIKQGKRTARGPERGRKEQTKKVTSEKEGEKAPEAEGHKDEEEAPDQPTVHNDENVAEDPKSETVIHTTPDDIKPNATTKDQQEQKLKEGVETDQEKKAQVETKSE